jgi:hypothetical protein
MFDPQSFLAVLVCMLGLMAFVSFSSMYMTLKMYPEIGMVVKSQCKNPTPSWNGKVLGLQVCPSLPLFLRVCYDDHSSGKMALILRTILTTPIWIPPLIGGSGSKKKTLPNFPPQLISLCLAFLTLR